jgi:hypothetical protein
VSLLEARLRRLLGPRLRPWLDRGLARLGFDVVRRDAYSPVPEVPPPDDPAWGRVATLAGLELDTDAQLARLEGEMAPWLAELLPPREPPLGARLDDPYFGGLDALALWATVRALRPARTLEIGAGNSTRLLLGALDANGAGELASVDPDPRPTAESFRHPRWRLDRRSANALPLAAFESLAPGDLLFVDSSHTVKRGSEVNRLVLEVLPRLAAGVVVHVHDVFLPWDYPRAWFVRGTYLAEQYLLHAYLVENPRWEIRLAVHALWREHGERLARRLPGVELARDDGHGATSLWLRRR